MKNKTLTILATGCHPDDIEFMYAGTLFLLKEAGATIHYMNIANGSCGTKEYNREEIIKLREAEGKQAAAFLGAEWHPSICDDMEVVYDLTLVRKVAATIRLVAPDIVIAPSLFDYMEDHMNTARIVSTAAFTPQMINFVTDPVLPIGSKPIALYHALPYGLEDVYQRPVVPHFTINISSVLEKKREMLSKHISQRNWLDDSQKLDSYVLTMQEMSAEVGKRYGSCSFGEGFVRHNPLGYCAKNYDPLREVLQEFVSKPHES